MRHCIVSAMSPSVAQVEVEYLGDDLPAAADQDEGQQIGEEPRADRALHEGKGGDGTGNLDRHDAVVARLAAAARRGPRTEDGEVPIGTAPWRERVCQHV